MESILPIMFVCTIDLLNLPNVVGFEQFHEVVIRLLTFHFLNLRIDSLVVCGSLHVADNTQGYWETVFVVHHGQLQL